MGRGLTGFLQCYGEQFGDRWSGLHSALLAPERKYALKNPFHSASPDDAAIYELDPASVLVARSALQSLDSPKAILDLCASPGGKALSLIFSLRATAEFVLNDLSSDRVARLKRVLHRHLPEALAARVRVTNHDGSRWGLYEKDRYDLVLVDAPCSGERHLLESEKDMAVWSIERSRGLAHRQHALLCAALDAAKPGGRIVYSTCALATNENDGAIEYFLKKRKSRVEVLNQPPASEELSLTPEFTRYGWQILPDRNAGAGPMYACCLQKID